MKKFIFTLVLLILALTGGFFWFFNKQNITNKITIQPTTKVDPVWQEVENNLTAEEIETEGIQQVQEQLIQNYPIKITETILQVVPFTSQAPLAEWHMEEFQDGCEEASVIMSMRWVNGEGTFSKEDARKDIIDLVDFQQEKYGEFRDRSATDTAQMIRDYYDHELVESKSIESSEKIIEELIAGDIVIVPVNGQILGNPNFTQPGPENHMLVIIGFDPEKREFITNDPGTRLGEGYRYDEKVLFNAIRDYPTGNHEFNPATNKVIISVGKL